MKYLKQIKIAPSSGNIIYIISRVSQINKMDFSDKEKVYIKNQNKQDKHLINLGSMNDIKLIYIIPKKETPEIVKEECRKAGYKVCDIANQAKAVKIYLLDVENNEQETLALAEGIAMSNYQFLKYKKEKKQNSLREVLIFSSKPIAAQIKDLNIVIEATFKCRDLINEPLSELTAQKLAEKIKEMAVETGAKVEIFNKKKIETLKMGGLLAVNKGSIDPPTFTIVEWKPKKPVNKKPIVLVGKGVVYDTGGISLKPSKYMETMKCDMSGAAMMASSVFAVAKAKLPVHVVALIPATDNRPDGNAYVPGDVVNMFDGTTVEVLNTDAEGRMILADALSYAKKYKPKLVIDAATLTGSAASAIGKYGIVGMCVKANNDFNDLKKCGENVYERIVEFPMWEEYSDMLKSDIADMKNIGGAEAGAITAGKFLEHFTDYPFIHLDIAGPAFVETKFNYRGVGGTGVGVRLLFNFFSEMK